MTTERISPQRGDLVRNVPYNVGVACHDQLSVVRVRGSETRDWGQGRTLSGFGFAWTPGSWLAWAEGGCHEVVVFGGHDFTGHDVARTQVFTGDIDNAVDFGRLGIASSHVGVFPALGYHCQSGFLAAGRSGPGFQSKAICCWTSSNRPRRASLTSSGEMPVEPVGRRIRLAGIGEGSKPFETLLLHEIDQLFKLPVRPRRENRRSWSFAGQAPRSAGAAGPADSLSRPDSRGGSCGAAPYR